MDTSVDRSSVDGNVMCECEGAAHFGPDRCRHVYGRHFPEAATVEVMTPYGRFRLCGECVDECGGKA